jgi:hypothetical protein
MQIRSATLCGCQSKCSILIGIARLNWLVWDELARLDAMNHSPALAVQLVLLARRFRVALKISINSIARSPSSNNL